MATATIENITTELHEIISRIREERALMHKSSCEIQQACRRIGDYSIPPNDPEQKEREVVKNLKDHLSEILSLIKTERVALEDAVLFLNKTV